MTKMLRNGVYTLALVLCSPLIFSTYTYAQDARSLAMGGAAATAGYGAAGALINPALMMNSHRMGEESHFNLNLFVEGRDSGDLASELEDNEDLIRDIENEIDIVSTQSIACTGGQAAEVCITDTENLAALSNEVLRLLNKADGESFDIRGGLDLGYMKAALGTPVLINIGVRGTASGSPAITENDKNYVGDLAVDLQDNQLTLGELQGNPSLDINTTNGTVDIANPDDVLDSTVSATIAIRTQFSIGIARAITVGTHTLDLGITPKISALRVGDINQAVNEVDGEIDAGDQFDASEKTGTSFTFDAGASIAINDRISVGAVAINVVPESLRTTNGVEIETTSQLVVSTLFETETFQVTADLALNEAMEDNFKTQPFSVGAEFSAGLLSLRAGVKHDLAVDDNPTDITFGLGLGPLNLAAGYNQRVVKAGIQIHTRF